MHDENMMQEVVENVYNDSVDRLILEKNFLRT